MMSRYVGVGCLFVLSGMVSAYAQTTTSDTRATVLSAGEQTQIARQYVTERLAFWQQRLKLEDWSISVVPARRSELKPNTLGGIRWDKTKKSAVIWVLDPSEYQTPFRATLDDMELTIVHELVHLELTSLPRSEASRSNEEHAVNGIAEALLGLYRERQ
jgi:hypothetical protein